jgi:hypothetical protein
MAARATLGVDDISIFASKQDVWQREARVGFAEFARVE